MEGCIINVIALDLEKIFTIEINSIGIASIQSIVLKSMQFPGRTPNFPDEPPMLIIGGLSGKYFSLIIYSAWWQLWDFLKVSRFSDIPDEPPLLLIFEGLSGKYFTYIFWWQLWD